MLPGVAEHAPIEMPNGTDLRTVRATARAAERERLSASDPRCYQCLKRRPSHVRTLVRLKRQRHAADTVLLFPARALAHSLTLRPFLFSSPHGAITAGAGQG